MGRLEVQVALEGEGFRVYDGGTTMHAGPFHVEVEAEHVVAVEVGGLGSDAQARGLDPGVTVVLNGVDVFRSPAPKVVVAADPAGRFEQEGETYTFPQLGVRLWRVEGDDDDPPAECFESILVELAVDRPPPPHVPPAKWIPEPPVPPSDISAGQRVALERAASRRTHTACYRTCMERRALLEVIAHTNWANSLAAGEDAVASARVFATPSKQLPSPSATARSAAHDV